MNAKLQSTYELIGKHAPNIFPQEKVEDITRECRSDLEIYTELNPQDKKLPKTLAAGSLYLRYLVEGLRGMTQEDIAKMTGSNSVSARKAYKDMKKALSPILITNLHLENE